MTQKIKVQLPEGFRILVQESKQWLPKGILCLVNAKGQRMYVKLAKHSEILKGIILEVLSVEELRNLGIEESYNEEVHSESNYVVEESAGEDEEQAKIRKQTAEWMEEQKKKGGQGVTINLIGKDSQGEGKSKEELEQENEDLKNKISLIAHKMFNRKKKSLNAPDSVTTPEELMDWEKTHGTLDPTRRPSSGSLSLEGQSNTGSIGFDSQLEMIQFLQRRIHSPKSSPEQVREARAVKDELWRKFLAGKRGKAKNEGFDDIEDEGTPLLTKFYEEWRKREEGDNQ